MEEKKTIMLKLRLKNYISKVDVFCETESGREFILCHAHFSFLGYREKL